MPIYPIEYRKIPTQYAFLIEKTNKGYVVNTKILTDIQGEKVFKTEEEAREFINNKEII